MLRVCVEPVSSPIIHWYFALKRYEYFNYINLLASIVVGCIIIQLTFLHLASRNYTH